MFIHGTSHDLRFCGIYNKTILMGNFFKQAQCGKWQVELLCIAIMQLNYSLKDIAELRM